MSNPKTNTSATPSENTGELLYVIKIGGNIIDDEQKLASFLDVFALIKEKKILIHGGGKLATKMAEQLNIPQQLIEGRRVTDDATLRVVTMVYAGYINKNIIAQLQSKHCDSIGICGADCNLITAKKRIHASIDYGFAGDITTVNVQAFQNLFLQDITPVIAPITHDGKGQLLNTNADTIAQEIAKALSEVYNVSLIYSFEKTGVLQNVEDESTIIPVLYPSLYEDLKSRKIIFSGMIPKLDNAFAALESGVEKVIIGKAEALNELLEGRSGTSIVLQF